MAASYVKIYYKNELFRTYGGNTKDVREMIQWYKNAIPKKELKDYTFEWHKNHKYHFILA